MVISSETIEKIETDKAPLAVGPYSQAVKFENLIFISGQIAIDPKTNNFDKSKNVIEQTEIVLENIRAILSKVNLTPNSILKTEIFLTDMNDFKEVNEIYSNFFTGDIKPARQTVEVSALPLEAKIEISCIVANKQI